MPSRLVARVALTLALLALPALASAQLVADGAKVEAWMGAALRANEAEDADLRRLYAQLALKTMPEHVDVLFMLGRFESYDGNYERAEELLREAIRLAPENWEVYVHLMRILGWQARYDEAFEIGDMLVEKFPEWVELLLVRGDVALWAGQHADAERHYRMALAVEPEDTLIQRKVLIAIMEADDGDRVREYLDELPRDEDDRWRSQIRRTYESGDENFRVDAAVTYSFSDPGEWAGWSIGAMGRLADPFWLGLRGSWEHRNIHSSSFTDSTLTVPAAFQLSPSMSLELAGSRTFDAQFAPAWGAETLFTHEAVPLFGYSVGYRFSRYVPLDAHTIYPSVFVRIGRFGVEPVLLATVTSDGQTSYTGRLQLLWFVSDSGRIELWGHVGTEPLEPNVALTLEAPRQAGFLLGLRQDVNPLTEMRFLYGYSTPIEDQEQGRMQAFARHTLALTFTRKFRLRRNR